MKVCLSFALLLCFALVARTSSSAIKQNGIRVVVGAFDFKKGKGIAAFNLGSRNMPRLHKTAKKILPRTNSSTSGCSRNGGLFGSTNRFGACAEFQAMNKLLKKKSKFKNILFTQAHYVKTANGRGKLGSIKPYCANCKAIFSRNLR